MNYRPPPRRPAGGRPGHLQGAQRQPGRGRRAPRWPRSRRSARSPTLRDMQVKVIDNQGESVTSSLLELAEAGGDRPAAVDARCCSSSCATGRRTLMVTLAIPICFVMTLGFMYFVGVTLNILSMMGLLLARRHAGRQRGGGGGEHLPGTRAHARTSRALRLDRRHPRTWPIALSAPAPCATASCSCRTCSARPTSSASSWRRSRSPSRSSLLASWLVAVSLIPMMSRAPEDAAGGAPPQHGVIPRLQRRYAAAAALDAGAPRLERARHPADRRGQPGADEADQDRHVRRRRRRARSTSYYNWKGAYT